MPESRTGTSTSFDGGGYGFILGDPRSSGCPVKVASRGADREERDPWMQPYVGFANTTRFSDSEVLDIVAAQGILGEAFPSMKGPRDVVWPRL
jgi:hypothetical protein